MSREELRYFFGYSRKDSECVLRLAKELRAAGANLWLDQLDILGGQHWDRAVEEALNSCNGMIVVLSPDAVASDNVMDEVSYALDEGKLVVPILVRSCDFPLRLRRLHHVDFTADYDTGFAQLLRALHIEPPAESPEAPEPTPDESDQPKPAGPKTEKALSNARTARILAAICIVALIATVSIGVFIRLRQPEEDSAVQLAFLSLTIHRLERLEKTNKLTSDQLTALLDTVGELGLTNVALTPRQALASIRDALDQAMSPIRINAIAQRLKENGIVLVTKEHIVSAIRDITLDDKEHLKNLVADTDVNFELPADFESTEGKFNDGRDAVAKHIEKLTGDGELDSEEFMGAGQYLIDNNLLGD
jgi:hypothetical protein